MTIGLGMYASMLFALCAAFSCVLKLWRQNEKLKEENKALREAIEALDHVQYRFRQAYEKLKKED